MQIESEWLLKRNIYKKKLLILCNPTFFEDFSLEATFSLLSTTFKCEAMYKIIEPLYKANIKVIKEIFVLLKTYNMNFVYNMTAPEIFVVFNKRFICDLSYKMKCSKQFLVQIYNKVIPLVSMFEYGT